MNPEELKEIMTQCLIDACKCAVDSKKESAAIYAEYYECAEADWTPTLNITAIAIELFGYRTKIYNETEERKKIKKATMKKVEERLNAMREQNKGKEFKEWTEAMLLIIKNDNALEHIMIHLVKSMFEMIKNKDYSHYTVVLQLMDDIITRGVVNEH